MLHGYAQLQDLVGIAQAEARQEIQTQLESMTTALGVDVLVDSNSILYRRNTVICQDLTRSICNSLDQRRFKFRTISWDELKQEIEHFKQRQERRDRLYKLVGQRVTFEGICGAYGPPGRFSHFIKVADYDDEIYFENSNSPQVEMLANEWIGATISFTGTLHYYDPTKMDSPYHSRLPDYHFYFDMSEAELNRANPVIEKVVTVRGRFHHDPGAPEFVYVQPSGSQERIYFADFRSLPEKRIPLPFTEGQEIEVKGASQHWNGIPRIEQWQRHPPAALLPHDFFDIEKVSITKVPD